MCSSAGWILKFPLWNAVTRAGRYDVCIGGSFVHWDCLQEGQVGMQVDAWKSEWRYFLARSKTYWGSFICRCFERLIIVESTLAVPDSCADEFKMATLLALLNSRNRSKRIEASKPVLETYHESFLYGKVDLTVRVRGAIRSGWIGFIWHLVRTRLATSYASWKMCEQQCSALPQSSSAFWEIGNIDVGLRVVTVARAFFSLFILFSHGWWCSWSFS